MIIMDIVTKFVKKHPYDVDIVLQYQLGCSTSFS